MPKLKSRAAAFALCVIAFPVGAIVSTADADSTATPSPDSSPPDYIESPQQLLQQPATLLDLGLFRLEQHTAAVAARVFAHADHFHFDEAGASGSPYAIEVQLNFTATAAVSEKECVAELERFAPELFTTFQTFTGMRFSRFEALELYSFFAPADERRLKYKTYADKERIMAQLVDIFRLALNFIDSDGNTFCVQSIAGTKAVRTLFPKN